MMGFIVSVFFFLVKFPNKLKISILRRTSDLHRKLEK